jgi:repressor LexA
MTKRQLQILEFIRSFVENHGYPPTLQEIADSFSLRSLATVHKHLQSLAAQGYLRRGSTSRSIDILTRPERGSGEIPLMARLGATTMRTVKPGITIPAPPPMTRGHRSVFALQIMGDFLREHGVCDGDYLVCEDRQTPEDGDLTIAQSKDGRFSYSRFQSDGEQRVLGVVLGLVRYL